VMGKHPIAGCLTSCSHASRTGGGKGPRSGRRGFAGNMSRFYPPDGGAANESLAANRAARFDIDKPSSQA
jgi:hypothetical protein